MKNSTSTFFINYVNNINFINKIKTKENIWNKINKKIIINETKIKSKCYGQKNLRSP